MILQVLAVSTKSSRFFKEFIVKILGCTSRPIQRERLPYSSHPGCMHAGEDSKQQVARRLLALTRQLVSSLMPQRGATQM